MDFMRALSFPFDDDEWLKKIGLAVLIQLIPLVGVIALQGWSYEISRRVKEHDPEPLPGWSDFGGTLAKGLNLFIAGLIYQLPVVIYVCVLLSAFLIPVASSTDGGARALAGGATLLSLCASFLLILYGLAAFVVYQGGYVRYLEQPQLGTFFQFKDNFAIVRENLGVFGQALLYVILAGALASAVSGVTAGIGSILSTPFLMYFTGHIIGQLYLQLHPGTGPAADVALG